MKKPPKNLRTKKQTFDLPVKHISMLQKLSKHHGINQVEILKEAIAEKYAADLNI